VFATGKHGKSKCHVLICIARSGSTWEKEHLALLNPDVPELALIHDTKKHPTSVLIEPLLKLWIQLSRFYQPHLASHLCLVNVVVITFIRASYGHDKVILSGIERKVANGWLEQVLILREPFRKV
jgi:hypothetical protein